MFTEGLDCSHMPQVYYPHINQYVFKNRNQIISLLIRTLVQLPMLLRRESKILWQARPSMICPYLPLSAHPIFTHASRPAAQEHPKHTLPPCPGTSSQPWNAFQRYSQDCLSLCTSGPLLRISLSKQPFQTRLSEEHTDPDVLYVLKLLCLSLYHVFPLDFFF